MSANVGVVWKNWAGNITCEPERYFEPATEIEIVDIVLQANHSGDRLKVIGLGHSCSRITASDGATLVSLKQYNQVISINKVAKQITVQAGMSIKEINRALLQEGLALSNLDSISTQSIGGALSTGTHGTGLGFGCFADQVQALSLITLDGEVLQLSAQQQPELFYAACTSLGSLGVISTVTLACEDAYNLHAVAGPEKLPVILKTYPEFNNRSEHFRFWWFPHTQDVYVWEANRTAAMADPRPSKLQFWLNDVLWMNKVREFVLWLASFLPALVPKINQFVNFTFNRSREEIGRNDHIFNFLIQVPQYVMEYAIPIEHTQAALTELEELIEANDLKVHLPVEVRFVKGDNVWLSMAYQRDSCFIGVIMYRPYGKDIPYEEYFKKVDTLMAKYQGRPHWAKVHYRDQAYMHSVYPQWEAFSKLRAKLDPQGIFMNDYLQRFFK